MILIIESADLYAPPFLPNISSQDLDRIKVNEYLKRKLRLILIINRPFTKNVLSSKKINNFN